MIFELYWYDVENSESFLFEKDTSREEFISDCNLAMKRAGEEILRLVAQETSPVKPWITASEWTRIAANKLEEMGYFQVRPNRYGVSGEIIDAEHESYVSFTGGEDAPELGEIVGEGILKKVIVHNVSIREEHDRKMRELREKKAIENVDNKY
jgi:hypothetical protein